jgi:integrase
VDRDLVCPRPDGDYWIPDLLSAAFSYRIKTLAATLGIPVVRFHDLRHSHATHLLRAGVHPKIVSERLGHSSVLITLDTYSHVLPDMQERAALAVDAGLGAAIGRLGRDAV